MCVCVCAIISVELMMIFLLFMHHIISVIIVIVISKRCINYNYYYYYPEWDQNAVLNKIVIWFGFKKKNKKSESKQKLYIFFVKFYFNFVQIFDLFACDLRERENAKLCQVNDTFLLYFPSSKSATNTANTANTANTTTTVCSRALNFLSFSYHLLLYIIDI